MTGAIILVAGVGLLVGFVVWIAVWTVMRRRLREAAARETELAAMLIKLGHDLRGALSPALLISERLEANTDPVVRQAGAIVGKAMDRAAEMTREASRLARDRRPEL